MSPAARILFPSYEGSHSEALSFNYAPKNKRMLVQQFQRFDDGESKNADFLLHGVAFFQYSPYPDKDDLEAEGYLRDPLVEWPDSPLAATYGPDKHHYIACEGNGYLEVIADRVEDVTGTVGIGYKF